MAAILAHREVAPLLSDEHFSVDGTLIKAWASMKGFQPKAEGSPPGVDGPNDSSGDAAGSGAGRATASDAEIPPPSDPPEDTTPDTAPAQPQPPPPQCRSRLPRREALQRHPCLDHRPRRAAVPQGEEVQPKVQGTFGPTNGDRRAAVLHRPYADGEPQRPRRPSRADPGRWHAERRAALDMIHRHSPGSTRRLTLGADKGYDSADFVADLRRACVTPHVAQKARHSAIEGLSP